MATLHVRNVPDSLYESLRARAHQNGRSIGAESILLLEQALAGELAHRPGWLGRRRRPRRAGGMFTRFTVRARRVVVAAQAEAEALGHDHVGTEHLLLGALSVEEGAAAHALHELGLTLDGTRDEIVRRAGHGEVEATGRVPFSPGAKRALELALREALALGHDFIGTEHVLLGLLAVADGLGAELVYAVEPDRERVRRCVLAALAGPQPTMLLGSSRVEVGAAPFLVVELESRSAEEWETALNEATAKGYELVEIVERRAIFRCD